MTQPQLVATLLTATAEDASGATGSAASTAAASEAARPVLIVGPSLGTGVKALWGPAIADLAPYFTVIGWDLPGHGDGTPVTEGFSIEELAAGVKALIEKLEFEGQLDASQGLYYAGVSVGGATGYQLGISFPGLFKGIAPICTAAKIGTPEAWNERADLVEKAGTPTMVSGSALRWFAPGFIEKNPVVSTNLLHTLQDADRVSYAFVSRALAGYDVREQLGQISDPLIAIAGRHDAVCPPGDAEFAAARVQKGHSAVVETAAHLAPAEDPAATTQLLVDFFLGEGAAAGSDRLPGDTYDAGMVVRREVLGSEHVDRATSSSNAFTDEFQEMITRYAWGTIWTRPGLPRTTRSAITLTAMIAGGYWEELEMHVHAALRNGMTPEEIKEVFLQSAIYCSVPAANVAFKIGKKVLEEYEK